MSDKPCPHCGAFGGTTTKHLPNCVVQVIADRQARDARIVVKFVAVRTAIMQGGQWIATACSKTMAKRIANALNKHTPNREGV